MIVVATSNWGKLKEFRDLSPEGLNLVALQDVSLDVDPETGATFLDNALIKARSIARHGYIALADDSGLVVDALDGRPGVRSARFAGEGATDQENNAKLLRCIEAIPPSARTARFKCAVVLSATDLGEFSAEASVDGRIIENPRGSNGFGYDPLFEITDSEIPEFVGKTMAELSTEEKNRISHRSRAFRALLTDLSNRPTIMQRLLSTEPH